MPSPAGAWLVVVSILFLQPMLSLVALILASALMCSFKINWIHFSRALPTMRLAEIFSAPLIGAVMVYVSSSPATLTAGPIVVYIFSPKWRKPPVIVSHATS